MGRATAIGWTESTWNPIRGCRRTAPKGSKQSGCGDPTGGGCYAERQAARFCGPGQAYEGLIQLTANGPRWTGAVKFVETHLIDPLRWERKSRIFTDSMSDLFFDGFDDDEIDQVVAVQLLAAHRRGHIFQTLTKRVGRMRRYMTDPMTRFRVAKHAAKIASKLKDNHINWKKTIEENGILDPHLWWGASLENQAAADDRLLDLCATPAAVRFLSIEPMIGPIVIGLLGNLPKTIEPNYMNSPVHAHIDWVIVGCESGPGARPCRPEWMRAIRDECEDTNVALFLKQAMEDVAGGITAGDGTERKGRDGALLHAPYIDGKQYVSFPEVAGLPEWAPEEVETDV